MKIVTLVENTEGRQGCATEHGLSFYIETATHRILFDTGATEALVLNAALLGVDLSSVDTVIISHGHSDHGGGLPGFIKLNNMADIWLLQTAGKRHFSASGEVPRDISLPAGLFFESGDAKGRLRYADKFEQIDDGISLFSDIGWGHPGPPTNSHLMMEANEGLVRDDFSHEQCLVIEQSGKYYLFSGCAHHGVLNILDCFKKIYKTAPAYVFGGFHLMRHGVPYIAEDRLYAEQTAQKLKAYTNTSFYTCHCTGEEPYGWMKAILGSQLNMLRCGDSLTIKELEP